MDLQLVTVKYAYRPEHMTVREVQIWTTYLQEQGFQVNALIEFFDLFGPKNSSEFATNELRIRYWKWYDHDILEMTYFPGDTEAGVILMDDVPILDIDEPELNWIGTPVPDFNLKLFELIRMFINDDPQECDPDEIFYEDLLEYFQTEHGQQASELDTAVAENYRQTITDLYQRRRRERVLLPQVPRM